MSAPTQLAEARETFACFGSTCSVLISGHGPAGGAEEATSLAGTARADSPASRSRRSGGCGGVPGALGRDLHPACDRARSRAHSVSFAYHDRERYVLDRQLIDGYGHELCRDGFELELERERERVRGVRGVGGHDAAVVRPDPVAGPSLSRAVRRSSNNAIIR